MDDMSKRHFYWVALAGLGLLAGCKPPAPTGSQSTPPLATAATPGNKSAADKAAAQKQWDLPDTDKPQISEPRQADDAQALAQATRDYARAMEMLLTKNVAAGTGIKDVTAKPSDVHFEPTHNPTHSSDAAANSGAATTASAPIPGGDHPPVTPERIASLPPGTPVPAPTIVSTTPPRPEVVFNKDSPVPNAALLAGQPRPLPATDDMAQRFAKQVKDYPQDVSAQFDWQLLQFLQGQSVPQMQSLAALSAEDREMLSAVLDGLTNFRNALRADNNMLLSRKIRPMLELSDRLRTQAELSIPTVALCTDVKGFGVYEPLEPARFPADNKEHRVIVYCEVENFASQLDEQKRWQTKLTQDVVLYTEGNGLEVWRDRTPARPIIDYSRNRRHDFFIVKMVRLPANLTIGRYLLKVTVTDQQVNRVAENTVPIQIVAE
jgi:hypothetical protein